MTAENLPSNSHKSRAARPQMEQVTNKPAEVKKPGIGDKMKRVFGGDSMKRGVVVVITSVVVPAILDMSKDAIHTWVDGMFSGGDFDNVRRRGYSPTYRGPNGQKFTDYTASSLSKKYDQQDRNSSRMRRNEPVPRGDILIESRAEGDHILTKLDELIRDYDYATRKDLLELAGITASFTDDKWGWNNLAGAGIHYKGGELVLRMPPMIPLD